MRTVAGTAQGAEGQQSEARGHGLSPDAEKGRLAGEVNELKAERDRLAEESAGLSNVLTAQRATAQARPR